MRVPWRVSIGTTIFGAFVAMGLLLAVLGSYGLYVLNAAGDFVVQLYDRPLMALNFDRAASLDFAEMDKELIRRTTVPEREWDAIDTQRPCAHAGRRGFALPLVCRDPERVGLGDLYRGGVVGGAAGPAEALTWRRRTAA